MALLSHDYLNTKMLKGLAAYKYKAGGYTWLDDLHNPAWNWIVENWFPMWLAPNLVTLSGLMFIVAAHLLLSAYSPDMSCTDVPRWAHAFAGLSLVMYVNLDCMDGKQARRTGTSSPLGQLFDHGCDALSVGLVLANACTSACLPLSPKMVIMLAGPLTTWILAQWEEYHTGVMQYGNGYFGILEANYALASVHFISGALGPRVWTMRLGALVKGVGAKPLAANVTVVEAMNYTGVTFMLIQIVGQMWRVFFCKHSMDSKQRAGKQLGVLPACRHLLYILALDCLWYIFLMQPQYNKPLYSRMMLLSVILAYTTFATQLIVAHMAKQPFHPNLPISVLGMTLIVLNWIFDVVDPVPLTYAFAAVSSIMYIHYVTNVCRQVCGHLGIKCLIIPYEK